MPETRTYAFAVQQSVFTKAGVAGVVIARQPGADAVSFKSSRDAAGVMQQVEILTPVNAYMVTFTGDNGMPDSAWWHEDMIEAVAV